MKHNLSGWLLIRFRRFVNSIAFYPAVIALLFLALSYLMIHLDYSELGKAIKTEARWLKLRDASTARSIISVVAAGILSLAVFSFTMVMVVLNQAASQLSNRVLDRLIGNKYQQFILGFYIGTIVYALFLLSAIRDVDSGIYVPSLSTYLLIAITLVDIFLFIYFLHYITQSVKFAVVIRRIHGQTEKSLKESCRLTVHPQPVSGPEGVPVLSPAAGLFEGFDQNGLLELARKHDFVLHFLLPQGSFILKQIPIARIAMNNKTPDAAILQAVQSMLWINQQQAIDTNYYYGFRQLTEIAIKALSPGINDPGTAVYSLRSLAELLAYRMLHFPDLLICDEDGVVRIQTLEPGFEALFEATVLPVWDYGKQDRFIQTELKQLLEQMRQLQQQPVLDKMLLQVNRQIEEREDLG